MIAIAAPVHDMARPLCADLGFGDLSNAMHCFAEHEAGGAASSPELRATQRASRSLSWAPKRESAAPVGSGLGPQ